MVKKIYYVINRLKNSKFRSSFKLKGYELGYLRKKGIDSVREDAFDFIRKRIAPDYPKNDGKQTPYKNHPVFIAQHATATCCRKCLEKWHKIKRGRKLSELEIEYIVNVIMSWISTQI